MQIKKYSKRDNVIESLSPSLARVFLDLPVFPNHGIDLNFLLLDASHITKQVFRIAKQHIGVN
ncbi:MAG: hypothetical protein JAY99_08135 [Candidatus Thiodiazotropha lotti]|nr:hypothetical protein [Candidatus Thiodiazotropha lotti]MCG7999479.1 hypothetical protein [Candidatus Thiodiazotropha lotti]MCW4182310.1 hypothetical protein [Candidatus Thiodiazotropha weberae]MCW4191247.1 hypothetical protein [Candidatus Thiodiazotropha weberae]